MRGALTKALHATTAPEYSLAMQPAQVYCTKTALFFKAENEKIFRYAVGSGGPGLS